MYHLNNTSAGRRAGLRFALFMLLCIMGSSRLFAQLSNIPVTGFNVDIIANGTGATNTSTTGSMPGVTYPAIGVDGNTPTAYTFIDATYKWYSGSTAPTCFLPTGGAIPSALTSGLTYQLQSYTANNSLDIASNSFTGSLIPTTGTLTLVTPGSYGKLFVLYETVLNTSGPTITATVNFTDGTNQVFSGNSVVNWFTATSVAYTPSISRAGNTAPGAAGACSTGPYLFELPLTISAANYGKLVQSLTINWSAATGTSQQTVDYFHALALGGMPPCASPVAQPTSPVLTSVSTSQINGSFTAATGTPSGYLVVRYPAGSTVTNPVNGTTYTAGTALGLGTVVQASNAVTFNNTGLNGGTSYDYYVYSYNSTACAGGPLYFTTGAYIGTAATSPCGTLSGVIPVGPTAPASPAGFATLTSAVAYITTNGLGGATYLELQPDYLSSAEPSFPITLSLNPCINASKPLTIRPASTVASALTITTSNATAVFDLNGASYITIDGRPGGTGTSRMLNIINTSTTAISTVRFINEANNNLVTYCDIQGSSTTSANPTTSGVVYIGSTTGANGNDNNTISFNNIHAAGSSLPAIGIGAYNSTTAGNVSNNDNNTINGNNIYDFFIATANTTGIKVDAGNNNYSITNNHIYESASRAFTSAVSFRFLWLNPNSAGSNITYASGHTVTGNYFGGNAANGSGIMTITGSSTSTFLGMDISVGNGTGTTVSNDTITNISFQSTSIATTGTGQFSGISVNYGNVNTITNNVVGAVGTGLTVLSSGATVATLVAGIRIGGGILADNISNNQIGNINANMTANTVAHTVYGILLNGGTTTPTITNNNIGPLTTGTNGTTATGSAQVIGISTSVISVTPVITGNTIHDLTNYAVSSNTGATGVALVGILINNTSLTSAINISNNSIYKLNESAVTTSVSFAPYIQGIFLNASTSSTITVKGNNIHSFGTPNWSPSGTATGIPVFAAVNTVTGSTVNIINNMVRLGIDGNGNSVTQPIAIRALYRQATTGTFNIYHNSVYVGGTGVLPSTAATQSAALFRQGTATADNIQDNIFVNVRDNATTGMKHYAIYLGANTALTLNYNDYYNLPTATNIFGYNAADVAAYTPAWMTTDLNSQFGNPQFNNPTGNATAVDLHINPSVSTPIEQTGTLIATVTDDYDGQTRASLTPVDMGADAGNFTPVNPCSGTPPASVATLTNTTVGCGSVSKTIYLGGGFTPQPGYTYQWQESTTGLAGSFVNVSTGTGANTSTFVTATLSTSMYYQCIVSCSFGGVSTTSTSVFVQVNSNPVLTVSPASGSTVCSGSNVDLSASGAATYTWACNPGVTGYPAVSLFSTPNNLAKVTSRPTSTLSSSVATPPATTSTPTWTYTVTGTDAVGCVSTSTIILNVTTTALIPLTLNVSSSPDPICTPGIPVTFNVTNGGTIGSGQWIYNWYDSTGLSLLQTATNTSASNTYSPAVATTNGNKAYTVKVSNTVCPSSYAIATASYYVGFTSLIVPTNSNCGNNGSIAVYPEGQSDPNDWYVNNFSTGLLGPAFDAVYGNTNFTGGICNITPQVTSQNGTLLIRNPGSINTNNLQVDFKLSTAPLGFAYNILGADGMAWSYAPDVYQGTLTPAGAGFNAESGSGTGFKLAFDATANGAQNTPGVYLMYNCTTPDQGPTSPGVLAFKQGSFWQNLINAPVRILISENGYVTVSINNQVIFDHVALPLAYLTANKSNWIHAFTARTGGSDELHAIDDLSIRYNAFEYSITSTNGNDGNWQGSNVFTGLSAGTYPVWVRKLNDPSCFTYLGNTTVNVDPSPSSASTVPVSGYSNVVCYGNSTNLTSSIFVPGATFYWETATSLAGPWNPAPGTNNNPTYLTPGLTTNTYYRITFTCPSSSPVTASPLLVTVNAGTIASTNSPQLVNCIGDAISVSAVPGPNTTCAWYSTATGGSPLALGNTYTTTATSLPVTYYVEPVTTIYSNHYYNGGQTVIANTFGTASSSTGIATVFSTSASVIIDSIKVLPGATGTLNVALQAAGSATNIASYNFTVTAAMVGNFVNVPVNLTVPSSGNYQLTTSGVACSYYSSYSGSYSAAYMSLGGVFTLTGAALSATSAASTVYYGTAFRIAISSSCPAGSGARIPVLVQSNPAYAVNVTPSVPSTCQGLIQTLAASSANAYTSYSWTPVTDLYTDAAATIPYTAGTNLTTVYVKPSSGGVKTYTVSTSGSGCTNTGSGQLNVVAAPAVITSANPSTVCQGSNAQLNASVGGTYCTAAYTSGTTLSDYITNVTLGSINNSTGASGSPYNTYYSALNTNLVAGSSYTVTGTINNGGTEDVAIWIDYNHSGTFDASEKLGEQQTLSFSIGFTVPPTALNGTTRMRVRNVYATTSIDPCNSYTWGEVEDYNVTISGGLNPGGYTYNWSANPTYLNSTNIGNPLAQAVMSAQTYTVQVTDVATGCTSTASLGLNIKYPSSSSNTSSQCNSYTWNGNTYTGSGVYSYTTTNAVGCDSIATLNLTINSSSTSATSVTTCQTPYVWNGGNYSATGSYTYTTTNAVGCDSVATLNLTITPCNSVVNLKCYIEGYWDGTSAMVPVLFNQGQPSGATECDSIDVELHDNTAPYGVVQSIRTVLNQNGTASCVFPPVSGSYYIVVKHRNAVQTWSANPVAIASVPVSYDFTTAASQAYGDNQVDVLGNGTIWAFFSGDIVIDENVDLLDLGSLEYDISSFAYGYVSTDLNGDGNVDLLDTPIEEANISNFVFSNHP